MIITMHVTYYHFSHDRGGGGGGRTDGPFLMIRGEGAISLTIGGGGGTISLMIGGGGGTKFFDYYS